MSASQNAEIGRRWIAAFNAYDVDALVALYAEDATHTSPKIRALHPETGGRLIGRAQLKAWWEDANRRLPNLRYELTTITADDDLWVYTRTTTGDTVYVAINRGDGDKTATGLPGGSLDELVTGTPATGPNVTIPARQARIFVAK